MTAPTGIITRVWHVDQARAEKFLALFRQPERGVKGTNRKFSPIVVNKYAFEMLAGRWQFTHQGLAFINLIDSGTAEGKDGEHRLRALIQACTKGAARGGVTLDPNPDLALDFMVTEGLDQASWRAMDIGKSRTPGDFMASDGEMNSNVLSSAISLCHAYVNEPEGVPYLQERWVNSLMSPIQRQEFLDAHPEIRQALYEGARLGKRMTVSAAAAGYFAAIHAGIKPERIGDFMDLMQSGAGMDEGNPALALREMLLNGRNTKRNYSREEQLALFIKAFNKWNAGEEVKRQLSFKTKASKSMRLGKETITSAEVFPRIKVID